MKAASVPSVLLWSVKPVKRTTRVSLLAGVAELGALNPKRKKFVSQPNEQDSQSDTGLDQQSDSHNSGVTRAAKLTTNPDPFSAPLLFAVESSDTNCRVSYLEATISRLCNELEVEKMKSRKTPGGAFHQ